MRVLFCTDRSDYISSYPWGSLNHHFSLTAFGGRDQKTATFSLFVSTIGDMDTNDIVEIDSVFILCAGAV